MSPGGSPASASKLIPLVMLCLLAPCSAPAVDTMAEFLPSASCGAGAKLEGKPVVYDRETLSDRINGEAELFLPYGFDRMAAARYSLEKQPGAGMDVEIYRMGSPLDAFGMYANYRQQEGRTLAIGTDANLSVPQLFLYQGRYFVHIQVTGTDAADPDALAGCGRAVASRLPDKARRPPELQVLDRPEVVRGTERFLPQSLLGYEFLNRGIMADAVVEGGSVQLFLLLGTSAESAATAFDRYRSQLDRVTSEPEGKSGTLLKGVDPLYGPVIMLRSGGCLAGALKFGGEQGVRGMLDRLCR